MFGVGSGFDAGAALGVGSGFDAGAALSVGSGFDAGAALGVGSGFDAGAAFTTGACSAGTNFSPQFVQIDLRKPTERYVGSLTTLHLPHA